MAAIEARIIRLEEAARRRHRSGLSGERRKMLTDLAVLHGDMAASSEELSQCRQTNGARLPLSQASEQTSRRKVAQTSSFQSATFIHRTSILTWRRQSLRSVTGALLRSKQLLMV